MRIQDGTINDASDFWQEVMCVGYIIEGENRAFEREHIKWLAEVLNKYLDAHPEITESRSLDHFAMRAVARLASAFVFNDRLGADDPVAMERLKQAVIETVDGLEEFVKSEAGSDGGMEF
jgi:hypothetical protein